MLSDFGQVLVFMIIAVAFVAFVLLASKVFYPKRPSKEKLSTYECGENTIGETWLKFNVRFYVVALIFIIFDVEIVFLFPWAVVFREMGMIAFVEMAIFLIILIFGFIYVLAKGDLYWDKPKPVIPKLKREIFNSQK
jgi:NADH-quinone oxidoreductase subunit A